MFKVLLPLLLVGSSAFAAETCFVAKDTSAMKASIETDKKFDDVQQIVAASLKLSSGGKMYNGSDLADLSITTDQGVKAVSSSFLDMGTYVVECDGGRMSVEKNSDGSVLIKTDRIRADIEGCDGTLEIMTLSKSGTRFDEVLCEAPSTN